MTVTIRVQQDDFSVQQETDKLRAAGNNVGAVASFSGLVRDMHEGTEVQALFLEHYPGMTERSLKAITDEAQQRWPLLGITVIHRIGELKAGEQIVLVAVSSAHRKAAFSACEFIMDYLKTRAPFWKKCLQADGAHWVEAKESDTEASARW
jgi:molybdopterin synthase catalytic subunit